MFAMTFMGAARMISQAKNTTVLAARLDDFKAQDWSEQDWLCLQALGPSATEMLIANGTFMFIANPMVINDAVDVRETFRIFCRDCTDFDHIGLGVVLFDKGAVISSFCTHGEGNRLTDLGDYEAPPAAVPFEPILADDLSETLGDILGRAFARARGGEA